MGRNLGPVLRRELENLDKDASTRKSAMKALKSYVRDLDSKAIPVFLAHVSETKETGSSSGEYTISLYEVLARVHGPKIVPQIDNIMSTVIRTLSSSAGSFALHQACSKVIPAISRYGIDPTSEEEKKQHVIHSLCKPLSDSLLISQENLSAGAALCLKALVDSDNWRFASTEMVNEVCQRVAGALQKPVLTNSHMALVMALAKHNSLVVEAYGRLLIQTGLRILNDGVKDGNSQKRLSAIQMVNFLMKCLDVKSIFSELGSVIEEMEKCQSDQMAYVSGAAYEALQTAKRIANEKGSKMERTGSNYSSTPRRNLWGNSDLSPRYASPESQTVDSFAGFDSLIDSPVSNGQRSVNRKLWRRFENSCVDVSLKDGLFSQVDYESEIKNSDIDEFWENRGGYSNGFVGFIPVSPRNGAARSATPSPRGAARSATPSPRGAARSATPSPRGAARSATPSPKGAARSVTPSPQKSRSHINVDNVKIFTTPRKLIRSLQDPDEPNSDSSENQIRRFRTPPSTKFELSPTSKYGQNFPSPNLNHLVKKDKNLPNSGDHLDGSSESVSSTKDTPIEDALQVSPQVDSTKDTPIDEVLQVSPQVEKRFRKYGFSVFCGLFLVVFAVFLGLLVIQDQEEGYNHLVPT